MRKSADIWISVRDFSVINTVAAVDMKTTINCEKFADEHTDAAHFDRSSFVGLAWRPADEPICVEAYSTGKLNLPGAKNYQSCLDSFARLVPQLLKYTNNEQSSSLLLKSAAGRAASGSPLRRSRGSMRPNASYDRTGLGERREGGSSENDDESEEDEEDKEDREDNDENVGSEFEEDIGGLQALMNMNYQSGAGDNMLFDGWGCG